MSVIRILAHRERISVDKSIDLIFTMFFLSFILFFEFHFSHFFTSPSFITFSEHDVSTLKFLNYQNQDTCNDLKRMLEYKK